MTKTQRLNQLLNLTPTPKATTSKHFAVLVDPDKTPASACPALAERCQQQGVSFLLVGGSLITTGDLPAVVQALAENCDLPVVLFPGNGLHVCKQADAILLLSLISGRNPEFLIGQHVLAAPALKRSGLQILPTGYLLVDGGQSTTVSYISNTTPLPHDKPDVAACTALAGEMLGLKLIYLDAGSGALRPVQPRLIAAVRAAVTTPLVVGGGITSPEAAETAWAAGADVVVVGNGIERNPDLLVQIGQRRLELA